jgi:hypothetical protein
MSGSSGVCVSRWRDARSHFFSSKVVEDGYQFFAKRQLVTLFSAPNYCGEFDNAGAMMSVDEFLLCSFQVRSSHPSFFILFLASRLFQFAPFFVVTVRY